MSPPPPLLLVLVAGLGYAIMMFGFKRFDVAVTGFAGLDPDHLFDIAKP